MFVDPHELALRRSTHIYRHWGGALDGGKAELLIQLENTLRVLAAM